MPGIRGELNKDKYCFSTNPIYYRHSDPTLIFMENSQISFRNPPAPVLLTLISTFLRCLNFNPTVRNLIRYLIFLYSLRRVPAIIPRCLCRGGTSGRAWFWRRGIRVWWWSRRARKWPGAACSPCPESPATTGAQDREERDQDCHNSNYQNQSYQCIKSRNI